MSVRVEQVTEPFLLGEGPHWDSQHQALYQVDIFKQTIHKYVPATNTHTRTKLDGSVGFIVPVEGTTDQFIIGLNRKFVIIKWDGKDGSEVKMVQEIGEVDSHAPRSRLNDGKADPRGRIYAGCIGYEDPEGNVEDKNSGLYCIDAGKVTKVEGGIAISNGLAWDLKEKAFYYIDSLERNIRRYDYDVETGSISNLKYIFDFDKHGAEGLPDGATIDTDGNLWVAVFGGSNVIKINPRTGKLLQTVDIPAKQVTSVIFGGANYDILYVTSASKNIESMGGEQKPPCGATFAVTGLGVRGLPNINYKP